MSMTAEEMKVELERQEVEKDNAFAAALNELCKQHARNVQAVPIYVTTGNGAYITSAELRVVRVQ